MSTLVLLRHGESQWNKENLFTGWVDVDLSEAGEREARRAGQLLAQAGVAPGMLHTSLQRRAIRTANLALEEMDALWIPVRRSWRLNERHYGALQGKNKAETAAEFGAEQVKVWRRSYDVPPPPLEEVEADPRYRDIPVPRSECLKDVVDRLMPWWYDAIRPDLRSGLTVLVAAHGNSLRALVKHLDQIGDAEIPELNIPTGNPLVYDLDDDMRPTGQPGLMGLRGRYLDEAAAAAGAAKVAAQAGG